MFFSLFSKHDLGYHAIRANNILQSYLASGSVVVQVHEGPSVPLLPLLGVHKGLAEAHGVVHVVAAAAPAEGALGVPRRALPGGVAGAGVQLALAAGACQRVDHAGRGEGVHEGHLSAAWGGGGGWRGAKTVGEKK